MEVLNLAASALFNSFEKHNIDKALLLEGTNLQVDSMLKTKDKHNWDDFVKMYDNCSKYLGQENVAKEIGHQGIYNDNISLLTKVARNLVDAKHLYWYVAVFVSKHLFKNSIVFKYSAASNNKVHMEISIRSDLKDCPLVLETYAHLFENLPNLLGLPKARVEAVISKRNAHYTIYLKQTTLFKKFYSKLANLFHSNTSSIELMEQLQAQSEELAKVVEEKSQLLRIVCHDVASQVITIDYYLNKLMSSRALTPEEQKNLNITKSSASKLTNILRNVQNMEATALKGINLVPVNLKKCFDHVSEDFEPQLIHKNINLICKNNLPSDVSVIAEALSLETNVLGNLISNAIKFSEEGSFIELSSKLVGENVIITVKDEGVGISAEEKERIFTKKIRNSVMGTNGEMGTGFGLGIVANYISMFNGKITIDSNTPKGTIFTITLKAYRH